jgi:hypothetical protein
LKIANSILYLVGKGSVKIVDVSIIPRGGASKDIDALILERVGHD